MLDSEWPARKAAYERWLSPDNFDDGGPTEAEALRTHAEGERMMPTIAEKRARFAELHARAGLLRDPQSVRCRLGQISRLARLPGARLDQRRHGLRGGQGRRRRRPRLRAQPPPRPRRSDRSAAQRRFRGRLRPRRGGRARERAALHRRRRLGLLDRGLHRRSRGAPLRPRAKRSSDCARRAPRSTPAAKKFCSPRAARRSCARRAAFPRRCAASRPMRRRAPTCSTRRW